MIYLDTSAMTKLVVDEPESAALRDWLGESRSGGFVTSALGRVELMRTVLWTELPGVVERARHVLDGVDIIPLSAAVMELAEGIGPASLCSLDAIHLASAAQLDGLEAVVVYDVRLRQACEAVGFPVVGPG